MSRFLLLATLLAVLLGLTSAQTFCEKYSGTATNASSPSTSQNATLQINLLTAIVTRAALGGSGTGFNGQTVQGLFSSSGPLYNIFTGQTKYRVGAPNYVNDTAALGTLAGKLVSYFGVLFGCNAPGYPQPSNTNMFTVHQNMSINNDMETYFNNQLATTLQSFGVSNQTDLQAAGTALSYFNKCGAPLGGALGSGTSGLTQICGTSDCPIAGNANYATCAQYYGYPASSSGGNGATGKYAAGGLFVAAAAIVASLLL